MGTKKSLTIFYVVCAFAGLVASIITTVIFFEITKDDVLNCFGDIFAFFGDKSLRNLEILIAILIILTVAFVFSRWRVKRLKVTVKAQLELEFKARLESEISVLKSNFDNRREAEIKKHFASNVTVGSVEIYHDLAHDLRNEMYRLILLSEEFIGGDLTRNNVEADLEQHQDDLLKKFDETGDLVANVIKRDTEEYLKARGFNGHRISVILFSVYEDDKDGPLGSVDKDFDEDLSPLTKVFPYAFDGDSVDEIIAPWNKQKDNGLKPYKVSSCDAIKFVLGKRKRFYRNNLKNIHYGDPHLENMITNVFGASAILVAPVHSASAEVRSPLRKYTPHAVAVILATNKNGDKLFSNTDKFDFYHQLALCTDMYASSWMLTKQIYKKASLACNAA